MAKPKNPWKTLDSRIVHQNPWYSVRKDTVIRPDGKKGEYNVVDAADAVFIVAMDEAQNVYLIGQYRYTTGLYSMEIPAGGTEGKNKLQAAKRELKEETGLVADSWKRLGKIQSTNGLVRLFLNVYLATGLTATEQHEQADEGILELRKVPFAKALDMISAGEITDSETISSLTLAALYLKNTDKL